MVRAREGGGCVEVGKGEETGGHLKSVNNKHKQPRWTNQLDITYGRDSYSNTNHKSKMKPVSSAVIS